MGEFDLIAHIESRLARPALPSILLGIGDDAALLAPPPGKVLAVTSDTLNAGVHFPVNTSAEDIGYKSLAVSLSDIAAMGATPWWYNLNLSLPAMDGDWLNGFLDGLADAMVESDIALIGGDTTRGPLSISITAVGLGVAGTLLRRDGAKPGQDVWVSGALGSAACALAHIDTASDELLSTLNRPSPRLELGQRLVTEGLATVCADVSDGLLADAGHIARRSGVAMQIYAANLPVAPEVRALDAERKLSFATTGGDDYELVFTAESSHRSALAELAAELDLPLTRIGQVLPGNGVQLLSADGTEVSVGSLGFDHFSST